MYCSKCGKEIREQEKFCSFCGEKNERFFTDQPEKSIEELVLNAQNGDKSAFDGLYHKTYKTISIITRSFFPEDITECDDCIQEIYLKLWENLGLYDAEKGDFLPWLKKIAQNVCITNWNKKKRINSKTFSIDSEKESEETKQKTEYAEERLEFNPEAVMDQKETSKLVQEILNELPLQQKQCLLLYYAARYKQETIAEMLGIPKGTVKSRLFHGKKLVEEKVLAMEKKGTRLYGMSPIAFFIWLFTNENEVQAANAAFTGISEIKKIVNEENITPPEVPTPMEEILSPSSVKSAIGVGAKTTGAKSAVLKMAAAIAGVSVIGTGGYIAYDHLIEKNAPPKTEAPTEAQDEISVYKDLINAYERLFYYGEETNGLSTDNTQYGVSNPYNWYGFGVSENVQAIYYTLADINNDGYEECLFTSDTDSKPEQLSVYDIWTSDGKDVAHVYAGYNNTYCSISKDGFITSYISGEFDLGKYQWLSFDNKGNVKEEESYIIDSEHPLDNPEISEKLESHGLSKAELNWVKIPENGIN